MTEELDSQQFSLLGEAWIPVLGADGVRRDVSLIELFYQAEDIRMIACELPTQTFAILRLALAVLHCATDGPDGEAEWQRLWRSPGLPVDDITAYLDGVRDRFDLLHPVHPFYQVAGLSAGKDSDFGLGRLIADVPNGMPFLINRAGSGLASITPAEAAMWLVHCQAYDPSGIKTGAIGDPRVKGGKVYPMGVGPLGALGGVYLDGSDLRETLLLNLLPIAPGWQDDDDRDRPSWERDPLTATEESEASRGPYGLRGLYTWQARRIRLYGDRSGITSAMISYGDPLDLEDRHRFEPMSVWGRSGPREKERKRTPVYLPRPHDHTRSMWRGLQTLLPATPTGTEPLQRLSPLVVQWMSRLVRNRIVPPDFQVWPRAVSVTYGVQSAVIDEVFSDSLTMNVTVLAEGSDLGTTAIDATGDAENAVRVLRTLAANLVRSAGGWDTEGESDRAGERAYALLDRAFREWLAHLGPGSDPAAERTTWQRTVRGVIWRIAEDLVKAAGPTAWVGRPGTDRSGKEIHYSSGQAAAWFRTGLAKVLPLAIQSQEVAA